ncbi:hydroxymethylglutaryl-CoA lyase [Sporosarcina sp. P2]|uniref:hydroxymethylglutaryl-CoA lyase n=1 Tax=Sporosarcina sp. P2 TaxID=2048251 RepID=UPI003510BAFE
MPTDQKLAFIHALQRAGIHEMEVTSFVSPKWVSQMSDSKEIMNRVSKQGRQLVLTPNAHGVENALKAGADSMAVFLGVSDTFNQHNINQSTTESTETLRPIINRLKNNHQFVRACLSTAFHCPYEDFIPLEKTLALCKKFVDMGVDELSVADTDSMANPLASFTLFHELKKQFPDILLTAHFHDTYKFGLANNYASMQAGIDMDKIRVAVDEVAPYLSRPIETTMYNLYRRK